MSLHVIVLVQDADITAGANMQGFTRDCVSNFLLRDCRARSFRRRRSGGPELFASVVWRSPIAQLTRPPSVVRLELPVLTNILLILLCFFF